MNGKKLLLDTNIVIGLLSNNLIILNKIKESESIFVPSIVIGELYYGTEQSYLKQENIRNIEAFIKLNSILVCDIETAKFYGQIKSQLKVKGKPIPDNDIWIAALGMQHKLSIVTRDRHFNVIDGIQVVNW